MRKFSVVITLILLLLTANVTTADAAFTDIQGNWAREAINRLEQSGVFDGLIEGSFQPNTNITREDVVEIAARSFSMDNLEKQNLYTWLDHFLPMPEDAELSGDILTRAELAALTAKLLDLDLGEMATDWYPSFEDIDSEHPAFAQIELIHRLGILPTYVMNRFEPNRLATRAEVASLLDAALRLDNVEGTVGEVYPSSNRIIVRAVDGEELSLPLGENSIIYGRGGQKTLDQVKVGDPISALYDRSGAALFVSLAGNNTTTSSLFEGLGGIAQSLSGVVRPDQVMSILQGDFSALGDSVEYDLYQQLVTLGVAPWEAEALLNQDWDTVQNMAKDRLAYEASDYFDLTPELAFSAMNQDWDRLLEYAQVELVQRLMNEWNL